ncbi:MAG: hypothetical protein R3F13_01345 [Prosthecobacter sp.]
MRNLSRFLEKPLRRQGYRRRRLVAFTTDHLERMTANNSGGELSARITATSQALGVVEDCVTDDQVDSASARRASRQGTTSRSTLPAV